MITVVRTNKALALANNPDQGVVVFEAPVNARHFGTVAHNLFEALGQTSAATGNRITATKHQIPLLNVALITRNIGSVVVDHAERCGTSSLTQLIHTAISAGVELVAVVHPPVGDHVERTFAAWPHQTATLKQATRTLQTQPSVEADPPHRLTFPAVPDDEFPHFLSKCRRTLTADAYLTVDTEYRRVLGAVHAETQAAPTGSRILQSLRRHLPDATSADHALVIVRAGTAAAFATGLFLTCPADQLRSTIVAEPYYQARIHQDWNALHTYRRPERSAVAVLATLGLNAAQICELTIADAEQLENQLQPPALVHLRRVALHRDLAGANSSDPLLTLADGQRMTTRWVRETLLDIGRSSNLPADRQRHRPVRESEYQWAHRLGIKARAL